MVPHYQREIKQGFEYRIASLGGSVLTLLTGTPLRDCAGAFELASSPQYDSCAVPRVVYDEFAHLRAEPMPVGAPDSVAFDNEDGGVQATQHLMLNGHTRIAFLGLHGVALTTWPQWSRERQAGWQRALEQEGLADESLAFTVPDALAQPPGAEDADAEGAHPLDHERVYHDLAAQSSAPLLERLNVDNISAVVAANDCAARVLIEQLRAREVPLQRWPAIVGFDNELASRDQLMSSLYLPWDELGRAAASLLWERAHGQLKGVPIHREVRARLIPRLTCNTNWSLSPHHAALVPLQQPSQ